MSKASFLTLVQAPAVPEPAPGPGPGRPFLPPEDRLHPVSIRLTKRQATKLKRVITPERLRAWIDSFPPDPA
jgi:hypothetical protein